MKLEHCSFDMEIECYNGCTTHCSKVLGGGTAHCQFTSGVAERGNTFCIKGKGSGGHKYENMNHGQGPTSHFGVLRQFLMFWLTLYGHEKNCV